MYLKALVIYVRIIKTPQTDGKVATSPLPLRAGALFDDVVKRLQCTTI